MIWFSQFEFQDFCGFGTSVEELLKWTIESLEAAGDEQEGYISINHGMLMQTNREL
jgi:hypothetical protein